MNNSNKVTNVVTPPLNPRATQICIDNVLNRPEWKIWDNTKACNVVAPKRWDVK